MKKEIKTKMSEIQSARPSRLVAKFMGVKSKAWLGTNPTQSLAFI